MALQMSVHVLELLYNESKFWIALVGALWAVFNGFQWIKTIKTNDLHHIQLGIDDLAAANKTSLTSIQSEIKEQTGAIVGELKELRNDIRMLK